MVTVQAKFEEFDKANPYVYVLFKQFALQALKAGRHRISSKLIIERIRWEACVSTTGAGWNVSASKPFLIDNRFTAWYARKFVGDFPKAAKHIEMRSIRTP